MDTLDLSLDSESLRENSPVVVINGSLLDLPLDALQIRGRLTPISAISNVSTRESSLNSSAHNSRRSSYYATDELEYDNVNIIVDDDVATGDKETPCPNVQPPGFNWSPLPPRKQTSDKSETDTVESEVGQSTVSTSSHA